MKPLHSLRALWCCGCVAVGLLLIVGQSRAGVLLSDDFSGGSLDAGKWTAAVDSGCSLSVSGGVLHSYFTGANAPRGAYAVSKSLTLPTGWTSVTITGQWAYVVKVYGEMVMQLRDADLTSDVLTTT